MRKLLAGAILLILLLSLAVFTVLCFSESAQDRLLRRAIIVRVSQARTELYDKDSLDLVFCGTGSPLADRDRGKACVAVFAGGYFFLVDSGPGASERLSWYQVPMGHLTGVLFTHFHSDHIGGLGEIVLNSWAAGRRTPLKLYGPRGIELVAEGFQTAYKLDSGYRTAHHGEALMPPVGSRLEPVRVDVPTDEDIATVFEKDGLKITAFRVAHGPIEPAYGYRFDYRGRSAIFSGDTVKHPNLARVGRDVDLMVHEACANHMMLILAAVLEENGDPDRAQIMRDVPSYHTTPVEAAEIATEANARLLVYSHVLPPLPNKLMERIFLRGVAGARRGETLIAHDGLHLELPVGSKEILRHDLN